MRQSRFLYLRNTYFRISILSGTIGGFFRFYMGNLQNFDADHTYSYLMEKVFLPACRKNGIEDRTTVNYVAKFYLQGITAMS